MLTKPEATDIPELKIIWKTVFQDTDSYIELFFRSKFSTEKCLVFKESGCIVSTLYYTDVMLTDGAKKIRSAYICGIATLPEFRGNGIAGKLIEACLDELRRLDYDMAFLIPAEASLFGYYRKFGFEEFSYISRWSCEYVPEYKRKKSCLICERTPEEISLLNECYGEPVILNGISYYKTDKNEYTALEYTEVPGTLEGKTMRTAYNPLCNDSVPFTAAISFRDIEFPEKKYINLLLN